MAVQNTHFRFLLILLITSISLAACKHANTDTPSFNSEYIAEVPAAFPVNFALFTSDKFQYVAYYDTAHQIVIASRQLNSSSWDQQQLDSKIQWDSHNYLSLAVDSKGYIHLVGNMHSSPLVYFRSKNPHDIHSMEAIHYMTGTEEDVTTYPEFLTGPEGALIFHYRYGISGSGYEVYNTFNSETGEWSRLLDTPLTDGQGKMNAYMQGPLAGPDGFFHLLWVWRNTPNCATNHTLSYARSKDLLHWESIQGEPVNLPITLEDSSLQVDPTPIYGGLINIGLKIGFDQDNKFLAGYHKYDSLGNTQLFIARFEQDHWASHQVSKWNYRWDFKGYGTIKNELLIESIRPSATKDELIFGFHFLDGADQQIVVDNASLKPIRTEPFETRYPIQIDSIQPTRDGMKVNIVFDQGNFTIGKNYLLRWETFPANRDQKPSEERMSSARLELIEY